jgi:hypothetical protein
MQKKIFNRADRKTGGLTLQVAVGFLEEAPAQMGDSPAKILLADAEAGLKAIKIPIPQRLRAFLRAFRPDKE